MGISVGLYSGVGVAGTEVGVGGSVGSCVAVGTGVNVLVGTVVGAGEDVAVGVAGVVP